jgi:hypothetical protein
MRTTIPKPFSTEANHRKETSIRVGALSGAKAKLASQRVCRNAKAFSTQFMANWKTFLAV